MAALFLTSWVVVPVSATACSCGDLDCANAAVGVDLRESDAAASARICVDGGCVVTSEPGFWPAGWLAVDFEEFPTVHDDEDFELTITVLDVDGAELATLEQTRNFHVDECRCLSFPYRLDGTTLERAD